MLWFLSISSLSGCARVAAKHHSSDNMEVARCVILVMIGCCPQLAQGFWMPHLSLGTASGQGAGPQQ